MSRNRAVLYSEWRWPTLRWALFYASWITAGQALLWRFVYHVHTWWPIALVFLVFVLIAGMAVRRIKVVAGTISVGAYGIPVRRLRTERIAAVERLGGGLRITTIPTDDGLPSWSSGRAPT